MALKLYKEDNQTFPAFQYVDDASPPSGYTATDTLVNWDDSAHPYMIDNGVLSMNAFRVLIKASYDAISTPTDNEKKIGSKWFVVDKAVRDTVKTDDEQKADADIIFDSLSPTTYKGEFVDHISEDDVTEITEAIDAVIMTISNSIFMYMMVSGTVQLECSFHPNSSHHIKVDGNATIDLGHLPDNITIYLMIEQDMTGGHTVTLPTFDNLNTQPTVTTTAGKMDVITLMKMHDKIHLHSYIKPTDTF